MVLVAVAEGGLMEMEMEKVMASQVGPDLSIGIQVSWSSQSLLSTQNENA